MPVVVRITGREYHVRSGGSRRNHRQVRLNRDRTVGGYSRHLENPGPSEVAVCAESVREREVCGCQCGAGLPARLVDLIAEAIQPTSSRAGDWLDARSEPLDCNDGTIACQGRRRRGRRRTATTATRDRPKEKRT